MFPERCDSGAISYLEGEGVPENWGIVNKGLSTTVALISFLPL